MMRLATSVVAMSAVVVLPPEALKLDLSSVLRVVDEQPLEQWSVTDRTFRFIWIPPFPSMRMLSVRIQELPGELQLAARAAEWQYDKGLGVVPVRIDSRLDRQLTPAEWDQVASMREDGFWKFHPQAYPQPYHDGSIWVLEGSAGGERLRIVQHVPQPSAFKSLCQKMLSLFNLRLREQELSVSSP